MGYRHSEADILEAACGVAHEAGIAQLTFRRVGAQLGISDRMVVYYFPSKLDLVTAVVGSLTAEMANLLEEAFGSRPLTQQNLVRRAWPVLTTPAADRVFAIFFEIVGLASTGQAPYDTLAADLANGWVEWLGPRVVGSTTEVRARRALATVAQIDGLLLIRHVLGAEAGETAAQEAGVLTRSRPRRPDGQPPPRQP